jgi:transglutaminase-like putative cysteine protease
LNYRINHTTTYAYKELVTLCQNLCRLTPRPGPQQSCLQSNLLVIPQPAVFTTATDYYGNPTTFFSVQEPHQQLTVTATHVAQVIPYVPPDPGATPSWEAVRDQLQTDRGTTELDAYQFVFDSPLIPTHRELGDYALTSFVPGRPVLEAALDLTRRIHTDFRYDPRATTVTTPLRTVFANRRGVCQDFAHLEIACLRSIGLAARYVSGYLCTIPPPGQPHLIGADASHAWLSIYTPGSGWVDLDPTNNQVPSDKHILLAWGRDYDDVSPIKGVILGGGQHTVHVAVDVVPFEEGG